MCCDRYPKQMPKPWELDKVVMLSLAKPGLPNTRKANHLVLSWAQKIRQKYFGGASKGPGLLKDSIFAPSKPQASNIWAIFACKPRLNHLNLFKNMIRLNRLMVRSGFPAKSWWLFQYVRTFIFYLYLLCRYLGPCTATKRYPHHLPVRPNKGRLFLRNSIQTQKHKHIRRVTQTDAIIIFIHLHRPYLFTPTEISETSLQLSFLHLRVFES